MFLLKLSVCRLSQSDGLAVLRDFVASVSSKYAVRDVESSESASRAEVVIAVPFANRELIRVDFNVFAAQFEAEHPEVPDVYFRMESA